MQRWRTALITGASSGIGEAFARRLAQERTNVVVVARREERLRQLADDLGRETGVQVEVIVADLTDADQREPVEARLADRTRPVDLLVNNAGISSSGAFVRADLAREVQMAELKVVAAMRLTHAVLPGMVERGRGTVVNISSLSSLQPYPFGATYGASNAFLTSFSKALHTELEDSGVTVTAVCPGFARTELQARAGIRRTPIPGWMWSTPDQVVDGALQAAREGREMRVPGGIYRAWWLVGRFLPERPVRRVIARLARRRTEG